MPRFADSLTVCMVVSVMTGPAMSRGAEPAGTTECVILVTTPSESEVIDATDHGSYLLQKWVQGKDGPNLVYVWKRGPIEKVVPRIDGYTHSESSGLSDNDQVIYTAMRHTVGVDKQGRYRAFVWEAQTANVTRLPLLDGYQASYGYAISHDGTSACGYQTRAGTGNVPVVWTKGGDGKWDCEKLPVILDDNPRLTTAGVRISPNGRLVVAPITAKLVSGAVNPYVSETCMWTLGEDGSWTRQTRSERGLAVCAVNDDGTFVGHCTVFVGPVRCPHAYVCTLEKGLEPIGVLDGDVASEACDINNRGVVVGWSTDPYGPTDAEKDLGYDDPFVWTAETGMRKLVVTATPSNGAHGSARTITDGNRIGGRVTIVDELNEPAFTAVLK